MKFSCRFEFLENNEHKYSINSFVLEENVLELFRNIEHQPIIHTNTTHHTLKHNTQNFILEEHVFEFVRNIEHQAIVHTNEIHIFSFWKGVYYINIFF